MIEGFKVTVTAAELADHLRQRAKHHHEKADKYDQRKEEFADAPEDGGMSNDPVNGLKEAGARHRAKASLFDFWARHIPAGETYLLGTHELDSLELTSGGRVW